MKRTILCLSFDQTVSASRRAALEQAGYTVVAATGVPDALQMLSSVSFDLLIVGHRFSSADKHNLAVQAREKSTPVLLISGAAADPDIPADIRVYALEGTAGLVATVAGFLPVTAAAARTTAA
ncbi:MAG TPA: response regulator [Terriglobales bacterium]|nr:response regulator [Terriglobales bacterium]